jgi:hypothetical protein
MRASRNAPLRVSLGPSVRRAGPSSSDACAQHGGLEHFAEEYGVPTRRTCGASPRPRSARAPCSLAGCDLLESPSRAWLRARAGDTLVAAVESHRRPEPVGPRARLRPPRRRALGAPPRRGRTSPDASSVEISLDAASISTTRRDAALGRRRAAVSFERRAGSCRPRDVWPCPTPLLRHDAMEDRSSLSEATGAGRDDPASTHRRSDADELARGPSRGAHRAAGARRCPGGGCRRPRGRRSGRGSRRSACRGPTRFASRSRSRPRICTRSKAAFKGGGHLSRRAGAVGRRRSPSPGSCRPGGSPRFRGPVRRG